MSMNVTSSPSVLWFFTTESIKVNLTNDCWGTVIICVGNKCGGVCKETWSDDKSDMLCKNLGCGTVITQAENPAEKIEVIVKSLHTAGGNTNLNHSVMVMNDEKDTTCTLNSAYVVCSGDRKISIISVIFTALPSSRLTTLTFQLCRSNYVPLYVVATGSLRSNIKDLRYRCSGNVEVYFEGQWHPVCKDALADTETQDTICEEMKCGQHLDLVDYFGPPPADKRVISQLRCPPTGNKTIKECSVTADNKACTLGGIRCSGMTF